MQQPDEILARWHDVAARFLDQARLQRPEWQYDGIYFDGRAYTLVVRSDRLDDPDIDAWFKTHKPIAAPIRVASAPPPQSRQQPEHLLGDHLAMKGMLRTFDQLRNDIDLVLPADFPRFGLRDGDEPLTITVVTASPLSQDQQVDFTGAVQRLGLPVAWRFVQDRLVSEDDTAMKKVRNERDPMLLTPSRVLPATCPRAVRDLWEQDEAIWNDNAPHAFRGDFRGLNTPVPESTVVVEAESCAPADIRNYLTLYRKVALIMPLAENYPAALKALGITSDELAGLVDAGRLRLLLPQPLHRYPVDIVARLAEAHPACMVLSRELALRSLEGVSRRFPLACPDLAVVERQAVLRTLREVARQASDGPATAWMSSLSEHLEFAWTDGPHLVHRKGAMAATMLGLGPVLAGAYKKNRSIDAELEFWAAARVVEFGLAVGGVVAPSESYGYDHPLLVETVARSYQGSLRGAPPHPAHLATLIPKILAVRSSVPVLELANSFHSTDIERFREVIAGLVQVPIDAVEQEVARFNSEVAAFEQNKARWSWWDIRGLALAAGTAAAGDWSGAVAAEAIRWGIERAVDSPWWHSSAATSRARDRVAGLLTRSSERAVLVARMREGKPSK